MDSRTFLSINGKTDMEILCQVDVHAFSMKTPHIISRLVLP